MFENQTYEVILQRMLERVSENMNKREGSVIYDALAPAAVELASAYIAFDSMLKEAFGDTASRDYLIRLCAERGLEPEAASKAVCTVSFTGAAVPIGSRFSGGSTTYEYIGDNQLRCEEAGTIGNEYLGDLIPIDYVQGLKTAKITGIVIYGEDEEDTEALRKRYLFSFEEKAYGGNKADYRHKTLEQSGVGAVKIIPVWNGAGTVKLLILSSEFDKAADTLVRTVQNVFDPGGDGMGDGLAPIGHIVTVDTVTEIPVDIKTTITYDNGYNWESCANQVKTVVGDYLRSLHMEWADSPNLVVRIAQIEAAIISVQGIIDVSGTELNGEAKNITLPEEDIPVLGEIDNA